MKVKILATLAVLGLAGTAWADTNLLADSFNAGASGSTDFNVNLAARQSGLLAPISWSASGDWQNQIDNPTSANALVVNGTTPCLTTDFAPTINNLNLPMAVSFMGSMQDDGGDPNNWFSLTVGSSQHQFVNSGNAEYGILFRRNGGSQIFNNGSSIAAPTYGAGFALNQFIPITLVFSDSSGTGSPFNGNGSMVVAYANGVPFSTNNIGQMTAAYIGFCAPGWGPARFPLCLYSALQVSVVVPGGAPVISANLPSTAYVGQNVLFSVTGVGSSLSYQWYSNSVPILGATNTTLQLANITASVAANYSVTVSNLVGGVSTNVNLTVVTPTPGSYEADVFALGPQLYLRYSDSDINNPAPITVLNEGILGNVANSQTEGYCSSLPGPQPPSYPNFENNNNALGLDGSSGDVVIPALNLSSSVGNTITMSAWIYSYVQQPSYAGVLFERGGDGSSGLQIQNDGNGNNILDYDWATGGRWAFHSGLVIPNNQWCFVALVITPTNATIYLEDGTSMKTAVDTTSEGICTFAGTTHVGFDPAGSGRRFNGIIDETAIFSRALSPTEVNTLFASAVGAPPAIVADPVGVTNYTDHAFSLSPVISGAPPLSFQWYKDSNPISGATNNNYVVASAGTGDSGSYYLHVSNTAGSTNTDPVTVSITASAPFFTALQGATAWEGVPTTVSGVANGTYPITYQWLSNNVPLTSQTNTSLTVPDPEATTSYVLQAHNSYGTTNSPAVVLTVNNPALSDQLLYTTNGASFGLAVGINNDPGNPGLQDYLGMFFTTGNKPRQMTHLGYWDDSGSGPAAGHDVGVFQGGNLVASVYVPPGSATTPAYGWRWVPLPQPVTLQPNTTYSIFGDTNGLDSWPNAFMPSWNTVYVGNKAASTYLTWNWDNPFAFPQYPSIGTMEGNGGWNAGSAFGNVNLGSFPMVLSQTGAVQQITWTLGVLQSSTNLSSGFTDMPGATSPYTVPLTGPATFYRVRY